VVSYNPGFPDYFLLLMDILGGEEDEMEN